MMLNKFKGATDGRGCNGCLIIVYYKQELYENIFVEVSENAQ